MEFDQEEFEYLRIEREGMMDEAYWAAVNGIDFEEGSTDVF